MYLFHSKYVNDILILNVEKKNRHYAKHLLIFLRKNDKT